jgi:hypothetical protein
MNFFNIQCLYDTRMRITVSMTNLPEAKQIQSTSLDCIFRSSIHCYHLYLGQPHKLLPSGSAITILNVFFAQILRMIERINECNHSEYNVFFRLQTVMVHTRTQSFQHIQSIHKRMVRFQKLARNLFLTLHGHNVHRQQRQLSKFLMR